MAAAPPADEKQGLPLYEKYINEAYKDPDMTSKLLFSEMLAFDRLQDNMLIRRNGRYLHNPEQLPSMRDLPLHVRDSIKSRSALSMKQHPNHTVYDPQKHMFMINFLNQDHRITPHVANLYRDSLERRTQVKLDPSLTLEKLRDEAEHPESLYGNGRFMQKPPRNYNESE